MIKKTASKTIKTAAKKPTAKKKVTPAKKIATKIIAKTSVKKVAKTTSPKRPLKSENDGIEIALLLAQGMVEKKADDIKILDMRAVPGASTNFLVISDAQSDKQVQAIADSAEEVCFNKTKEIGRAHV